MRLRTLISAQRQLSQTAPQDANLTTMREMAADLAARVSCIPDDLPFWIAAVGGIKGDRYTLAECAREAGVPEPSLRNPNRLDLAQRARVVAILERERERAYGDIMRNAAAMIAERLPTWERMAAADNAISEIRETARELRQSADDVAQALMPIIVRDLEPDDPDDAPSIPLDPRRVAFSPRAHGRIRRALQCACGHTWIPRVARPAKCPKCQRYLDWGTTPVVTMSAVSETVENA